jgi:Fuc2NAc and GlcNAc transferase
MFPAAAAAFLLSLLAVGLYLPLAGRLGQLDAPNQRSAHGRPTLSSGGLAVVAALLLSLCLAQLAGWSALAGREWLALGLTAVLSLVGAADDRRSLSVTVRLGWFFLLSAVLLWAYPLLQTRWWSADLAFLLLLLVALVWLLNLYNFMDGIDGIAALQCVLVCLSLILAGSLLGADRDYLLLCAVTGAAYGGFLCFNWPPARLFMGDAGSLSAGFLLGWLGLWGVSAQGLDPLAWLLPMSPFLLDTAFTLLRRARRRERLTQAHSGHVYQRLARRLQSHRRVDVGLLSLHLLWLLPWQFAAADGRVSYPLALCLALLPQFVLIAKSASFK